jgi:hypothetical protein
MKILPHKHTEILKFSNKVDLKCWQIRQLLTLYLRTLQVSTVALYDTITITASLHTHDYCHIVAPVISCHYAHGHSITFALFKLLSKLDRSVYALSQLLLYIFPVISY